MPGGSTIETEVRVRGFPSLIPNAKGARSGPSALLDFIDGAETGSTIVHNLQVFAQHGKHCHAPKTIKANDNGNLAIAA